jgi:hypothetical protein
VRQFPKLGRIWLDYFPLMKKFLALIITSVIVYGNYTQCKAQELPPPAQESIAPTQQPTELPSGIESVYVPTGITDFIVEKGKRLGPITLESTPNEVAGILGTPNRVSPRGSGVIEQAWWTQELGEIKVIFVAGYAAQISATSSQFRTKEGVSPSNSLNDFITAYNPPTNGIRGYIERTQDGKQLSVLYCNTPNGIAVRVLAENANDLRISALIVSQPTDLLFPQIGASLVKTSPAPIPTKTQKTIQSKPAKPLVLRLTQRQKVAAYSAVRELETLKSYVIHGMDYSGYNQALIRTKRKVNSYIAILPKGSVRTNLSSSLASFDVALLMWRKDTTLSPLSHETDLQSRTWLFIGIVWDTAYEKLNDAKNSIR